MRALEYDVSFIRHGDEVPIEALLAMEKGKKALVKLESGKDAIDYVKVRRYLNTVKETLKDNVVNYLLRVEIIRDSYGLIVERR